MHPRLALLLWSTLALPVFARNERSRVPAEVEYGVPASATTVGGRVFVDRNGNGLADPGERGLPGVVVSDQEHVVVTGDDGSYRMPAVGGAGIVYVSVPTGYTVRGAFYRQTSPGAPGSDAVDFALVPAPLTRSLTFVHASDTHISEASLPRTNRLRALIDSIHPAFVLITGDLVRDALRVSEKEATGYYDLFQREIARVVPPVWTVPGNHEAFGIERALSGVRADHPLYGRAMYRKYRGPDYYSFNAGGVHFVGLNTVDIDDTRYYGHVDSLQLEWLARDLAVLPPSTPIVTFNHIPFFSSSENVHGYSEAPPAPSVITVQGKAQFRHTVANAGDVLARLRGHAYPLALAGHVHMRELLRYAGIDTRFEQAAAVVGPTSGAGFTFTSGITVYRVVSGRIDEGRFVPLGLDSVKSR